MSTQPRAHTRADQPLLVSFLASTMWTILVSLGILAVTQVMGVFFYLAWAFIAMPLLLLVSLVVILISTLVSRRATSTRIWGTLLGIPTGTAVIVVSILGIIHVYPLWGD